jgi:hypothetical protein
VDKVRNTFTQKLGPLPVWAWAALVLVAILGYWFFTKTGPFASSSASGSTSGAPSSGTTTNQSDNALAALLGSLTADLQALANRGASGPVPPSQGTPPDGLTFGGLPVPNAGDPGGVAQSPPGSAGARGGSSQVPMPSVSPIYGAVTPVVAGVQSGAGNQSHLPGR